MILYTYTTLISAILVQVGVEVWLISHGLCIALETEIPELACDIDII